MGSLAATSARLSSNAAARYIIAFCAAILAIAARWALSPLLGDYLPYISLYPAVAFAAWCLGVGPSALLTIVSMVAVRYLFISPQFSVSMPDVPQTVGLAAFACGAASIIALGEFVRRDSAALHKAQGELEEKVQQRTTELADANHNLGELSARLLHLQDEERRRIARELHDSVGQTLAALSMNLAAVGADIERLAKSATTIADSTALVNDMSTDIRTISYLLHPPLLDEAGLCSALTWYVKGFSERSKIEVDLQIPEDFGRLSRDLETAIFRVVQECLTNIHRHSGGSVARIAIAHADDDIRIEVQDNGKGIPPHKRSEIISSPTGTPGVGIRGMRERLRQLGGTLDIRSSGEGKGTLISARFPAVAPPAPPVEAKANSAAAGL
ncbi:MAG TPA: sensor histidine kinase [Candidatus Acidoferrum sp.]|nr:sensor histidine kinase [Candidatus Acidoferrum sp.]